MGAARTTLTVPLLGSTSPRPWAPWPTEWLLRCHLGLWWVSVGNGALKTVSSVNSDFPGKGAVRVHRASKAASTDGGRAGLHSQTQSQDMAEPNPGNGVLMVLC